MPCLKTPRLVTGTRIAVASEHNYFTHEADTEKNQSLFVDSLLWQWMAQIQSYRQKAIT